MKFIAKRKLHDTDNQFINEIKKDMLIQVINHIYDNYPELIDEYWVIHKFIISPMYKEIKLTINIFSKEG